MSTGRTDTVVFFGKAPASSTSGKWVWIATEGEWKGYDGGSFELDRSAFDNAVELFDKNGIELALNFDHERRQAAGWYSELQVRDGKDGKAELWGKLRLTAEGKSSIKTEAYKYTSIEFESASIDEVSGEDIGPRLIGVALTNYPFIKGQTPLAASEKKRGAQMDEQSAAVAEEQPAQVEAQEIDEAKAAAGLEALAMLRQIIGAGEDTDDAGVLARVSEVLEALQQAAGGAGEPVEEGTPAEASEQAPTTTVEASEQVRRTIRLQEQTIKTLSEQVKTLMGEREAAKKQSIEQEIDGYISTGRVLDSQRDDMVWMAEHAPERFRRLIDSLPESRLGAKQLSEKRPAAGHATDDVLLAELDDKQRVYAEKMVKFSRGRISLKQAAQKAKERAHLH